MLRDPAQNKVMTLTYLLPTNILNFIRQSFTNINNI